MAFPKTVTTIIAKARDRYADMSVAKGLDYFLNSWRLLADATDIRYLAHPISLVAGTREYDLPSDSIDVSAAYYQRTSDPTTWTQMTIKSKDELDLTRVGWRTSTQQTEPTEFYISTSDDSAGSGASSKAVIGLPYLPSTTSSGGYPRIAIFGQSVTDMLASDTLPAFVSVDQYFVASIKRQFAESSDSANIGLWRAAEVQYLGELTRHIEQIGAHKGKRLIPSWCQKQSVAR